MIKNRKLIAIGIPTYNEQRHELRRTLESLDDCMNHKLDNQNYGPVYNCPVTKTRLEGYYATAIIILDGLKATSETMQEYMESIFGAAFIEGPGDPAKQDQGYATFVVERKPKADGKKYNYLPNLHLYLLIKVDNRKKHNSHEWYVELLLLPLCLHLTFGSSSRFLRSHCSDIGATFSFCTDCGTYFDKACLKELVRYLEDHQDCSACCGRQRIMDRDVQDKYDPERDEAVGEYRQKP